ncbi:MAG TPA: type 4a pilus biogenesis protein PilO [Burkholderiales bacterium]|nr:type 4a pilus biogenesis protein PilO [Burkholderiales bacterium]
MTLDDLRRLDPKNIGSWPAPVRLGLLLITLIVIIIASYFLDWSKQLDAIHEAARKELALRDTFIDKKKQAIDLDAYRNQLAEVEKSFGTLLKQLPGKSEMEALLTDINQAGLGRGLQFELFKPASQESLTEFYAERPINIRVTGNYHDIGAFASDIAKLSRIVLLQDISLTPNKDGVLAMDAVAKTYRYLDEEEIAQQKKSAKDKNKAPKK